MVRKNNILRTLSIGAGLLALSAASANAVELPDLGDWPEASRQAADDMVAKYGEPDGVTDTMIVWNENGPWKKTVIYKEVVDHDFPMPHPDVLQQTVNYEVPADMYDELAMYDGSVIAFRTGGELSARCDKEGANFLAINLANDIVEGNKTVEEAREFYAMTMKAVMDGETPEYTQGFVFDLPGQDVGYKDEPAMAMSGSGSSNEQQMAQSSGSGDNMSQETMSGSGEAMVMADDQMAEGQTVTVGKVMIPEDGFVVIHAVKDGEVVAPQSIGHTMVKAGMNENVEVELDYPPEAGEDYMAMLHVDTGQTGVYEFGPDMTDVDLPVMNGDKPVIDPFNVTQ